MNNTVHILDTSVVVIESLACTSITSTYIRSNETIHFQNTTSSVNQEKIMHTNQLEVDVLLPVRLLNILVNLYPDEAEALPPVLICS